jgi:hypothetical protein
VTTPAEIERKVRQLDSDVMPIYEMLTELGYRREEGVLDEEQDIKPLEQQRVDAEEVCGMNAVGLAARNCL